MVTRNNIRNDNSAPMSTVLEATYSLSALYVATSATIFATVSKDNTGKGTLIFLGVTGLVSGFDAARRYISYIRKEKSPIETTDMAIAMIRREK